VDRIPAPYLSPSQRLSTTDKRVPNRGLNHRTPKTWCAPPTPALTL